MRKGGREEGDREGGKERAGGHLLEEEIISIELNRFFVPLLSVAERFDETGLSYR